MVLRRHCLLCRKKERIPEHRKMSKLHGILMKNFACLPNKYNSALTRKVATVAEEWALWTAPSLKQPFDRWGPASFRGWEGSRRQEESRNTRSIHSRKRRKHPNTSHAAREHLYFGTTHVETLKYTSKKTLAWTQYSFKRVIWHFWEFFFRKFIFSRIK